MRRTQRPAGTTCPAWSMDVVRGLVVTTEQLRRVRDSPSGGHDLSGVVDVRLLDPRRRVGP